MIASPRRLPSRIKMRVSRRSPHVLALGATALLLAGCYAGPGYDSHGPRNGAGMLVDPKTGVPLPGQGDLETP